MKDRILTKNFQIGEFNLSMIILFFDNAISVFVYEETPRLGTVGLSVPGTDVMPPSTAFATGIKHEFYVRGLGERISKITGKIALLSINVNNEYLIEGIWKELKKEILKKD